MSAGLLGTRTMNIIQFLEHYRTYPCLWDKGIPDFKNRQKRDAAEEALLPISGLGSVKELRAKIRSIRGTYNQEVVKIKNSRKYGGVYKPRLKWFDVADSFLKKNLEYETEVDADLTLVEVCSEPYEESISETVKEETSFPGEIEETNERRDSRESSWSMVRYTKQRRMDSLSPENLDPLNHQPAQEDEFTIFGRHVAVQLQKLPLEEAVQVEQDIQCLLTQARLRHIKSSSSAVSEVITYD